MKVLEGFVVSEKDRPNAKGRGCVVHGSVRVFWRKFNAECFIAGKEYRSKMEVKPCLLIVPEEGGITKAQAKQAIERALFG